MTAANRATVWKAAERIAFDGWLRTGLAPLSDDGIERKFNPNHDPTDGRFTSGPSGPALRKAAHASRARSDLPLGPVRTVKLKPLNDDDVAIVHRLAATRSVTTAMDEAWAQTLQTGDEHGFFVYKDGDRYYPGPMVGGEAHSMTSALYASLQPAQPLKGRFGVPIATFHTHPGNYPEAEQADNYDQNFGLISGAITIIRTRKGFLVGR